MQFDVIGEQKKKKKTKKLLEEGISEWKICSRQMWHYVAVITSMAHYNGTNGIKCTCSSPMSYIDQTTRTSSIRERERGGEQRGNRKANKRE